MTGSSATASAPPSSSAAGEALAVITDRARERGDLPARPAPGTVADIVFGTIWYRTLATRQPLDADLVDDLVGLLAPTS